MIRLKKLAGLLKEDAPSGLMNTINKVTDTEVKKMLSDFAIKLSDIEGYIMDMEETFERAKSLSSKGKPMTPADIRDFYQDSEYAHEAVKELAFSIEAYIESIHK